GLGYQAASNAAEIVAIEKISTRILPESQDDGLRTGRRRRVEWQRVSAAEVGVAFIECTPIARREEILRPLRVMQIRHQLKHRLPVLHVRAPRVFPVATKRARPSLLIPPGAQMPPPRARVLQPTISRGSCMRMPITQPR